MIKQKFMPLLAGTMLLFGCAGGPRVIDLKYYTSEEELISDPFDLNEGEEIKIIIDFSKFSDNHNYKQYGYVQFYSELEDKLFTIFNEITSFKYNDEDVNKISNISDIDNNTYMTTYRDGTITYRHDNPSKDDKITIVGKANSNYIHLVAYSSHTGMSIS